MKDTELHVIVHGITCVLPQEEFRKTLDGDTLYRWRDQKENLFRQVPTR